MIVTQGGRFAGWGLVILGGKPVWAYKRTQQETGLRLDGPAKLAPGPHTLTVDFAYSGKQREFGMGGTFTLGVDSDRAAEGAIDATVPFRFSVDETLDIGQDCGTPILEDYADRMPFKFSGKIDTVTVELK